MHEVVKTNPDLPDDRVDQDRVIPPDTGSPDPEAHHDPSIPDTAGASALASMAADLDATGGANRLDQPYSGPDDDDDHAL